MSSISNIRGSATRPARLGLRLEVAGAGSPIRRLLRARGLVRRGEALTLAQATLRKLRKAGVSARIVGSLAKDKFRADSDVDYLIENRGGLPESRVIGLIETAMRKFPCDVVFADRMDPILLKFMREEAKRGAPQIRLTAAAARRRPQLRPREKAPTRV